MTDLLIRAVARRPDGRLARPSVVFAFAVALAYGVGAWLQVIHRVEGGVEHNEPGIVAHWLRDSTLTLPLIFLAVWFGVLLARRIIETCRISGTVAPGAVLSLVLALLVATATAAGGPAHGYLFAAAHGGHELPWFLHLCRDGAVALAAALPISAAVCAALARSRPWTPPRTAGWMSGPVRTRRLTVAGMAAALVLVPVALVSYDGGVALARDPAVGVCPGGAPVKHFDVRAIDVDIPLNRFGDHDPNGKMYVLADRVDAVRAEEQSRHVTLGLREDPIQPLVIRANEGDCVEMSFTNDASGGDYGAHIDGLEFDAASSGDAVGDNDPSNVAQGQSRTYRYFVPRDAEYEGSHYIRPGPGFRDQVSHGLFGSLTVEPPGSTYLSSETGQPLQSGWGAMIKPAGKKAFREFVQVYHEIGNEDYDIPTAGGGKLPRVDPHSSAYRPGGRAINYRSEPFMHRLDRAPENESLGYSSYPFGDPATPTMRSYQGEPTKLRIMHGGAEMFHVFHMHGGGIRWRFNPQADHTFDYADTGLDKHPKTEGSASSRLDSQAFGPGESYDLEIEGGAGGVQQGAGEFLYHCHIAEHYIAGMWAFWRVYDTGQQDLVPLPDRDKPATAVPSDQLVGKTMPDGTTLTPANLDDWVRPQLPPKGISTSDQDAAVLDYTRDGDTYLGEPEPKGADAAWPDLPNGEPGHPNAFPGDSFIGDRPKILFDPRNGRPAFPTLRTHVGHRNPFSPNGHSGAPYLGETGDRAPAGDGKPDPFAKRPDGICPAGTPLRRFNVVALDLPIKVTETQTDPNGKIFVLAKDVDDVLAGRKPAEPLAIRGNIGDCIAVTLVSRQKDANAADNFAKVNMHIHHVQFDTQASDGVISGMSYEQSVRPYQEAGVDESTLTAAAQPGDTVLHVADPAKYRPRTFVAVGQGTGAIEVRQVDSVDATAKTVTLTKPLDNQHASGQWAGVEFTQYRWYPDVALDNIFWHDHVDGIHNWGHGLVGQFIVEPKDSTYHDPKTGAEVDSGTYVDIHTPNALASGLVNSSFRELALWTLDENPVTDSTINLRAAPFADRGTDQSTLFSSYAHGDPNTPLPKAYPGDPFVIRTINVGPSVDTFHLDGHRFLLENRYRNSSGSVLGTEVDSVHYGISERFTAALMGGAGGVNHQPGDYLYMNGIGRRFRQGAWGLMRVLGHRSGDLQALPGHAAPSDGPPEPTQTNGRPPATTDPGDPCPSDATPRHFDISAVDVSSGNDGAKEAFVPTAQAADVASGDRKPEPLVLHVDQGDCVDVTFKNELKQGRASLHMGKLVRTAASSGVNVGFSSEQTVAVGESRPYRYYADTARLESATIADFGDPESSKRGLYGAVVVAPKGATFTDPVTGAPRDVGAQVDVHTPGTTGYRDMTVVFSDDDPIIGGSFMPYPTQTKGASVINYEHARTLTSATDDGNAYSSKVHGDPPTPMLKAYPGDPVRIHAVGAPGSEQIHDFTLGGMSWPIDATILGSQAVQNRALGAWETVDAAVFGGAGGLSRSTADTFYGDLRRPFTEAGMWGLLRTFSDPDCPVKPLDGLDCVGRGTLITDQGTIEGGRPGSAAVPAAGAALGAPRPGSSLTASSVGRGRRPALRGLRAAQRVSRRALRRRGLQVALTAPTGTRAVGLALSGRGGAVKGTVRVKRGGALRILWRPAGLDSLRPGRYVLRVRAGRDARHLGVRTLRAHVVVTR
jgi:hypothetical protein